MFLQTTVEEDEKICLYFLNYYTYANIYAHLDSKSKALSVQALSNAISIKKENEESTSSFSQK